MKQFQAAFFLFTYMYTIEGETFYVSVSFEREIISFYMVKGPNKSWKISGRVLA